MSIAPAYAYSAPSYPVIGLTANALLVELPALDLERIQQWLRPVLLYEGSLLYQCRQQIDTVYFVTGGLLSGLLTGSDGKSVEVNLVGSEGVVGALEATTGRPAARQWVVQISGKALAMPAEVFRQEFRRGGALQDRTLHFVQQMLLQNAQCTLCNATHTLEQRLARRLLMAQDRVQRETLELTHESLALTLGVRRSGVTIAATAFRAAGLISYTRGTLRILDRAALEAAACECYRALRHEAPPRTAAANAPASANAPVPASANAPDGGVCLPAGAPQFAAGKNLRPIAAARYRSRS